MTAWRLFGALACLTACSSPSTTTSTRDDSGCQPELDSIRATIFKRSCGAPGCHGADTPALGLNLVDASLDSLRGASSALCAGQSLLVPGSPEQSLLYQKLLSGSQSCGDTMPLGAPPLPATDVECVAEFIRRAGGGASCETCGGSECVALASDPLHCGSCDHRCPEGVTCENGACSCAQSTDACEGDCVSLATDEAHCGACGNACASGAACIDGKCACPVGLAECGGACVDLGSDPMNCGECGSRCADGEVCALGGCASGCGSLTQCGQSCVDTEGSLLHCGDCGVTCSAGLTCEAGRCVCQGGGERCDGACVDVATDSAHCGACGVSCGAGEACVDGACQCAASATVSFARDVAPVLQAGCASAGCHSGARPKEGLGLKTTEAYAELVGVTASQCGGARKLVVPGSPSTSYLMQKLLDVDVCTGTQMPKAGMSLPSAELEAISSWICSGAPDN